MDNNRPQKVSVKGILKPPSSVLSPSRIPKRSPVSKSNGDSSTCCSPINKLSPVVSPNGSAIKKCLLEARPAIPSSVSTSSTKSSSSESKICEYGANTASSPRASRILSLKPPRIPVSPKSFQPSKNLQSKLNNIGAKAKIRSPKKVERTKVDKSLEQISEAIFERVCKDEPEVIDIADVEPPPGALDDPFPSEDTAVTSESESVDSASVPQIVSIIDQEQVVTTVDEDVILGIVEESSTRHPIVPPLDLNLLEDYDALLLYEAMEEECAALEEKEYFNQMGEEEKRLKCVCNQISEV